jgi:hypothetical protein
MVRKRKKLKPQTVTIQQTKASRINLQEIPEQRALILDQRKAFKITISQKDRTHERIPEKAEVKLHGAEPKRARKVTLRA